MKVQKVLWLMSCLLILLLAAGAGLARELQPSKSPEVNSASASPAANAPWFNIEIDTPGNTGQHPSIVIDPATGRTYISYYDATEKNLRLAMSRFSGSGGNCGPGNSWTCQTVDETSDVGQYSSIDINPTNGEIGIAYYDGTNEQLMYAHGEICPTCVWSKGIVDQPTLTYKKGRYASLKFDSTGKPYIAYYYAKAGDHHLMLASYVGNSGNCGVDAQAGKWQCDSIDKGEGVGQYTSLAIDGAGNKHIAYYDANNGDLWYARSGTTANCGPANTWLCYPVSSANDVGRYASLYVDNSNHFHIAYYDATTDKLKYAVETDGSGNCGVVGSAQCETIDSMKDVSHPLGISIAEDPDGYPVIAYESDNGSLDLARPLPALGLIGGSGNCGPGNPFSTWYCETIKSYNPWVPARQGDFASIVISESGLATIAYNGFITAADGNLALAYQRFQIFEPVIVANH